MEDDRELVGWWATMSNGGSGMEGGGGEKSEGKSRQGARRGRMKGHCGLADEAGLHRWEEARWPVQVQEGRNKDRDPMWGQDVQGTGGRQGETSCHGEDKTKQDY